MPAWRRPCLDSTWDASFLALVFFVRTNEEEQESIVKELRRILEEEQSKEEQKHLYDSKVLHGHATNARLQLAAVPWIRNYEANLSDIVETLLFNGPAQLFLCVDKQALREKNLIVAHRSDVTNETNLGRAGFREALRAMLILRAGGKGSSFDTAFDERPWSRISFDLPEREEVDLVQPQQYPVPNHISTHGNSEEGKLTIFSLIRLSEDEILMLKRQLQQAVTENNETDVSIINWPEDNPASEADLYCIFQHIKSMSQEPKRMYYAFFIDSLYLSGHLRRPEILLALERPIETYLDQFERKEAFTYANVLKLHKSKDPSKVSDMWRKMRKPVEGVRNEMDGFNEYEYINHADWDYEYLTISNPLTPTFSEEPDGIVFITCPITVREMRAIRAILKSSNDVMDHKFLLLQPSLPDDEMNSLLDYFDLDRFRKVANPPIYFIVIDRNSSNSLMELWEDYENGEELDTQRAWVLLVYQQSFQYYETVQHGSLLVATENLGYKFGQSCIYDLDNNLTQLMTDNMSIEELVGEDLGRAIWPEFRPFDVKLLEWM
jgi:hypothetical protein